MRNWTAYEGNWMILTPTPWITASAAIPDIEYPGIYNYLINTSSPLYQRRNGINVTAAVFLNLVRTRRGHYFLLGEDCHYNLKRKHAYFYQIQ